MCEFTVMAFRKSSLILERHQPYARKLGWQSEKNNHGAGIYHNQHGKEPPFFFHKNAIKAAECSVFQKLCNDTIHSNLLMMHIRLSSKTAVHVDNTHPYITLFDGKMYSFVHNGHNAGADGLPFDPSIYDPKQNDSEKIFAFLIALIARYGGISDRKPFKDALYNGARRINEDGFDNWSISDGEWTLAYHDKEDFKSLVEKTEGDGTVICTQTNQNTITRISSYLLDLKERLDRGEILEEHIYDDRTVSGLKTIAEWGSVPLLGENDGWRHYKKSELTAYHDGQKQFQLLC